MRKMSGCAYGIRRWRLYGPAISPCWAFCFLSPFPVAMERPFDSLFFALPVGDQRALLERALAVECDIDPLILRGRLLRQRGAQSWALAVEQELLPLF